jgi:hypothetical protein
MAMMATLSMKDCMVRLLKGNVGDQALAACVATWH